MDKYYQKEEERYRKEQERGKLGVLFICGYFVAAMVPIFAIMGADKIYRKIRGVMKK